MAFIFIYWVTRDGKLASGRSVERGLAVLESMSSRVDIRRSATNTDRSSRSDREAYYEGVRING